MEKVFEKKELVKKSKDFSEWYVKVILNSELADYAPVRGCMVLRPYGYSLWENIQRILDNEIKKAGVKNVYFPLFIPESLLIKEREHLKGFSPELAVVTIGGGEKLKENLIVRPTSETIIYEMFSKWISSWRDLPLKVNQWVNVVRWEKRTRFFLRTTEFLWQEGHTAHSTHEEALKEVMRALKMYVDFYQNYLAIDGICGRKSESDKFPGAKETFTFEMLMPDGKALQGCTAHDLGQNFAKVFNIKFKDKDKKEKIAWQTSFGLSTRAIGALIMVHGDDAGLVIPPKIAPIQIVIIPIFQGKKIDSKLEKEIKKLKESLFEFKVEVDLRKEYSPGWKFNEWELKGVPLRIEVGFRELKEKKATLVRRDNGEKLKVSFSNLKKRIKVVLDDIQKNLFLKSQKFLKENKREVKNYEEFKEIIEMKKGFIEAFWCEDQVCEEKIKKETKATVRCLPLDSKEMVGECIFCKKMAKRKWIFAKAY
jgi:prolyl-tRNA synthetase